MTWKFHKDTVDKQPDRDFITLNKMGASEGVMGAKVFILNYIIKFNI